MAFPRLTKVLKPGTGRVRVFYLATLPNLFAPTVQHLASVGLVDEHARVVLEKPL